MTQLNRLTSLVRKGDSISLTFKGVDGGTQILVTPSLHGVSADETDPTTVALIAALAAPFVVVVPSGESIEDALSDALQTITGPRAAAVEAHDSYVIALNDATARAKAETTKKAKGATAGKADKVISPHAIDPADDAGEGNDDGESAAAPSTTVSPAVASAASSVPNLFDLD